MGKVNSRAKQNTRNMCIFRKLLLFLTFRYVVQHHQRMNENTYRILACEKKWGIKTKEGWRDRIL